MWGRLQQLGGHVASYQDGTDLDTTTDAGELFLFLRGWMSRMETKLIRARTLAGLERARAVGKQLGRPRVDDSFKPAQLLKARERGDSWSKLADVAGVSRAAVRRRWIETKREVQHEA